MRDEYCSPWQVVNFHGHLLMVGSCRLVFSTAEEEQVSAFVEGKQDVFFLLPNF